MYVYAIMCVATCVGQSLWISGAGHRPEVASPLFCSIL